MESLLLYLSSFLYSVLWARHYQRRDRIRPRSQSTFSQVSWAFIIMLFPIILSCYRYGIGVDYENYVSLFENFHSSTWTSFSEENLSFEYANKALSDLGFYLTGDTFGVFGVYAVLTLVLLELALINYKDYISLPIATFIMPSADVFNVIEHRAAGPCDRSGFLFAEIYTTEKTAILFHRLSFRNWHTFHGFYYTFILLPERCGQYKVQIPVQQCRKSYYRPLPTTVYIADRTASVLCVAREIF